MQPSFGFVSFSFFNTTCHHTFDDHRAETETPFFFCLCSLECGVVKYCEQLNFPRRSRLDYPHLNIPELLSPASTSLSLYFSSASFQLSVRYGWRKRLLGWKSTWINLVSNEGAKSVEQVDLKGRFLWFPCVYFQKWVALHPTIRPHFKTPLL